MSEKENIISPSDELRIVNAFKYWYETNTEKGVTSIPDYICKGLLNLYQKEKEKNNNILGLVFEYGQIDGEHHKAWVIDQIVRILTGNDYDKWVQHYEYDEETGEDYTWDIGIAP